MNIERLIQYKLLNSPEIVNLVGRDTGGVPLIRANSNVSGLYPSIVYHEIAGAGRSGADDDVEMYRHTFELTYYCDDMEYTEIRDHILKALYEIGFSQIHVYTQRNSFTNLIHWTVHVRAVFSRELYDFYMHREKIIYDATYYKGYKFPIGKFGTKKSKVLSEQ